tara:strand:- start:167 stop:610 length:444 start_codon:yes stop_codon:yes gene_type:complete
MKALAAILAVISISALAQTVILYDDGTQYTVADNEKVYVSNYSKLYYLKQYSDGDIQLNKVLPSLKRDHVYVEPSGQGMIGSPQWCETYIPWSEGLNFNMTAWQRVCDVNDDGVYDMCDYYQPTGISTFEEIEWQDKCNDGNPWDGS